MFLPKHFIEDLDRIFEAAMNDGRYTAALAAKKLQQQALAKSKCIRLEDLDDATLRALLGKD
jgi:ParB-like chromosome segregation protein Spo0J